MTIKYGHWKIFEKILFSQMGNKMREKADLERSKIDKQNGIIRQFLNQNKNENNKKENSNNNIKQSMQFLVTSVVDLIEKRLPLSDDLLLLAYQYERQTGA